MNFGLAVILGYLIVARVTRFLNSDYLAAGLRSWVMERFGDGKLYYLTTCPWCASIWVSLPVALVVALVFGSFSPFGYVFAAAGLWLGYSYLHGLVTNTLDGD